MSKKTNKPETKTATEKEEAAIQRLRELMVREGTSPEYQNFAEGLKRAVSTPKDDTEQTQKQKRKAKRECTTTS